MPNPSLLEQFCSDGQKDAVSTILQTAGWSPENPNINGYQLNTIFNEIFTYLNYLKNKGLSFWEDTKTYKATAGDIDIVRYANKIYFAKQDSNLDGVTPKTPDTNPTYWGVLYDLDLEIGNFLRSDVNDETIGTLTVGTTFNVKGSSNRHVYLKDGVGHQRALFYHDDGTDTVHLRLYSPDGNSVITDLALKPSGEFSFNQSVSMVSGAWIFLEDGKHCITNNDGGGNFNIRVGCSPSANSKITEDGYGGYLGFDQSSGTWSINASATSQNEGDDFSSTSLLALSNTKCNFKNQPIWFGQQTSSSKTSNGYQILPSGVIIQWGTVYADTSTDTGETFTFPIAFPNTCFVVTGSPEDNNSGADGNDVWRDLTTTNFVLENWTGVATNFRYMAIGY